MGIFCFNILVLNLNDFYARDTSRKIRAVLKAKGERGERVGSTVPYGYMKSPDDPKSYIPDLQTAPEELQNLLTAQTA